MKIDQFGLLRNIADNEIELMLAWRNEPTVRVNMYTRHEISIEEHLAWWRSTAIRLDQRYFMYERLGTPLGIAAFTTIDIHNRNATWAFYASPSAPKGTGSRMEFLMLEHAFTALELSKLYCEVLAINSSVVKLHRKFGFSIETTLKNQYIANNSPVDIYRLSISADIWLEHRHAMYQKLLTHLRV